MSSEDTIIVGLGTRDARTIRVGLGMLVVHPIPLPVIKHPQTDAMLKDWNAQQVAIRGAKYQSTVTVVVKVGDYEYRSSDKLLLDPKSDPWFLVQIWRTNERGQRFDDALIMNAEQCYRWRHSHMSFDHPDRFQLTELSRQWLADQIQDYLKSVLP